MIKPTRTKMASSSVAWLSIIVKCLQQIIEDRTILKCSWEDAIASFLLRLGNDLEVETTYDNEIMIFIVFLFFACHLSHHTDLSYPRNIKSNCNGPNVNDGMVG